MKLLVIAVGVLLLAALIYADFRWRRWMAARRREHEGNPRARR